MTQPFSTSSDPDWALWQGNDQSFFLNKATDAIRRYCGWHLWPVVPVYGFRAWFGAEGLVMLPSTHVTGVSSVTVGTLTDSPTSLVADEDYYWDAPRPWLELAPSSWSADDFAIVNFTHGYDTLPTDLKVVCFEVASRAMEVSASNVTHLQTTQYTVDLNIEIGVTLTKEERERLSSYRLMNFGRRR